MALEGAGDTSLLLGKGDVPPVHEDNAAGASPFLLTCDHYGRLIPRVLGDLGLPADELTRHIAWDIGIAGVADALSKQLDAHLIAQRYSRLVIDCNRPPTAPSSIPLYHRDTRLPPLLLKLLRGEVELVVGNNEPYAVSDETDYTIPVHGEARGLMNSGIEIRQDLIAEPAGQSEWTERLARILGEIEIMLRAQGLV